MEDLILFPFNGNAKEAVNVINAINEVEQTWNILGFIDDNQELAGKDFMGHKILGGKESFSNYPHAKVLAIPGRPETRLERKNIIESLNLPQERFATIIHPQARVSPDATIGYNTLIFGGVVATINVSIGNHCIILHNSVIGHDSKVQNYSLIASSVSLAGNVNIGQECYVGAGATIIQEISVGNGSMVGIGSVVIRDINSYSTVFGNPAKYLPSP